ncbi:Rapid ALkalinization Factor [Corchorus capsularis]|uniref:Rapid ALkalinization Factor n=1 Tax=Corchorus capsularis TaxID=210143 RepID=A0A1R3I8M6_COCAP|nr:Rapid ALkalinization Factor [Corchorus capsularis]
MLLLTTFSSSRAQVLDDPTSLKLMMNEEVEWPWKMSAAYDELGGDEEGGNGIDGRRSLYWKPMHYYISYGALSANRVPCPPRSGRSYYTHNCFRTREPANPYSRGCSRITHCRR